MRLRGVVHYTQALVSDFVGFLQGVNLAFYREKLEVLSGSSVGAHTRHCIEHFTCFLAGGVGDEINYDLRRRDPELERDPAVAVSRFREIQSSLETDFPEAKLAQPILLRGVADASGKVVFAIPSTVGRELLYVSFHCLHHMAMVGSAARHCGLVLDPGFGKAPATAGFENNLVRHPEPQDSSVDGIS